MKYLSFMRPVALTRRASFALPPMAIAIMLLTSGCFTQQPISTEPPKNNDTYRVQYLFEHEGCKVYRFYDRGQFVYFTNCNGQAIVKTDSTTITNLIKVTNSARGLDSNRARDSASLNKN